MIKGSIEHIRRELTVCHQFFALQTKKTWEKGETADAVSLSQRSPHTEAGHMAHGTCRDSPRLGGGRVWDVHLLSVFLVVKTRHASEL